MIPPGFNEAMILFALRVISLRIDNQTPYSASQSDNEKNLGVVRRMEN
jgi:hypothetical protein